MKHRNIMQHMLAALLVHYSGKIYLLKLIKLRYGTILLGRI